MSVGLFDSGVGGLSVLEQAVAALPQEKFFYYADCCHAPYGEKSRAQVIELSFAAVEFLRAQGADAVLVACNTATSAAIDSLRRSFPGLPIVGMEPAVKPALPRAQGKRVLVLATPLTVREQKLHELLATVDAAGRADLLPLPGLVALAEADRFDQATVLPYLRQALAGLILADYGAVVLGCTHFNQFLDSLRLCFPPDTPFVDGVAGTVRQLCRRLLEAGLPNGRGDGPQLRFYVSGQPAGAEETARFQALLTRLRQLREA